MFPDSRFLIPPLVRFSLSAPLLHFAYDRSILPLRYIITFLQAHKDELAQRFGVVSIGLFGSFARGKAREDSDIDIAIELMPEKKTLGNFLGIRRYLEQEFGRKVDLGIESTLKPLARKIITKEIIHV